MNRALNFVQALTGLPKPGAKIHHPDFHLTLKPLWHPDHDAVEKQIALTDSPYILAHYGSQKALDHYLAQSMPSFGGLCYPHTKSDRIYNLERMMSITTLIDDTITHPDMLAEDDKRAELRQHYFNAIAGIRPPATAPIAQLLHEGLGPIKEQLSSKPRVWQRLEESLLTLIIRQTNPLALQMDTLTFDRYLELRRVDNYGEWAAVMTEYAIDVDMTDALAADASLVAMRTAAIDSITLVNDPYSFRKEMHIADSVNSVWLLMHQEGLNLRDALNKLAVLVCDNERKLVAARDKVVAGPLGKQSDVRDYLTELEHLASGNAEFHAISTRYHGRDFKGKRFTSGEVTIKPLPSTDEIAAADIAGNPLPHSIAWWCVDDPDPDVATRLRECPLGIETIRGACIDPYQEMVERVYADTPEEWRKVIGEELWYQYGVFDEKLDPQALPLDASGRRHMEYQFELAEQAGADLSSQSIHRALDIGCGWGPVLKFVANRFSHCRRIDGVNVSRPQLECAREIIEREGLADRVRLYLCNAKDIGELPDPDVPYDLAILRGSLIHFTPEVLQETMRSLASRMRAGGTVIISESLYKVDLATYQSFIPDKVDRAASGHRKTPEGLRKVLEDHGFAIIDKRILPSNDEVIRWYGLVKENLDKHYPNSTKAAFGELRDIAVSFSDALRKDKASSFSLIARRTV